MSAGGRDAVFIEAPARLHFGVLDLRGELGRRFGGLGAAIPEPSLLLEAAPASGVEVTGPDAERAAEFARRFLDYHGRPGGARLRVHRAIPAHAGLGSGTQLGLAVGRALAELYDLPRDAAALARAVDRGRRSAVGTWVFSQGGFVLEGGRREGAEGIAPLLARYPLPPSWRYVIAIPAAPRGPSGDAELEAFRRLPPPSAPEVERVAHLVLLRLLPGIVEGDLGAFGAALSEIQEITGRWFSASQGGVFAPGGTAALIDALRRAGAAGVGQSSWGPTAYAIAAGDTSARALAEAVRGAMGVEGGGGGGTVHTGGFANRGARLWRAATNVLAD